MKKPREVLVNLHETEVLLGIILYTDHTYEYTRSEIVIGKGKWRRCNGIRITDGFGWKLLSEDRLDIEDRIVWEQVERAILS